jgi:hypothetical protein
MNYSNVFLLDHDNGVEVVLNFLENLRYSKTRSETREYLTLWKARLLLDAEPENEVG